MHDVQRQVEEVLTPVYMVGGSVRDHLLGREPNDYDFATPLSPDDVEYAIKAYGRKPYDVGNGKRHGTVGLKMDGRMIEITTFRTERYEDGSRQPKVEFVTDLTADLSRRDFTINAMAMDSVLHDPFGGQADLAAKVIRCVGNVYDRFAEDPLRLLRAARFESQLGFEIDDVTMDAMYYLGSSILSVSKECWVQELDKLLMGSNVYSGLYTLQATGMLAAMIPELDYRVISSILEVSHAPLDLNERWRILLSSVGVGHAHTRYQRHFRKDQLTKIAGHLRFSKERREYLLQNV